ncbi:MAG: insulinase family protein [marine benthic group bacterium]|nr:insulinase family protein [Candidatus Benthicola marisminoris]
MNTPSSDLQFPLETRELDNGLRVILQPDHSSPVVAVHLMYHVGSRNELPGGTGFAHLFEHLLFQGSEHVAEAEHFRHIQEAGGTLNGSTWFDRTNYFETVPSNRLDLALWLESDRMGWFLPSITQAKLDNQRDVVKNERRQSYENRPYGLATETVLRHAFPEAHPYRHPTIGYMEDLHAADLDDVKRFFETWYGPGNAVLVLCGDFDTEAAMESVRRYFGEIAARPDPARTDVPTVETGAERVIRIEDTVSVPRVYAMYHAPPVRSPSYETGALLASVLAGGKSSRLYQELVYDRRVAADVHAHVWPLESVGMLWVVATARPGVSASSLQEAVDETLLGLVPEGPSEAEVAGARNRAQRQLLLRVESVGGRADALAHAAVLKGDPALVNSAPGRYASVSAADVDDLGAELLRPERRTVVHVVPGESGATAAAEPESPR